MTASNRNPTSPDSDLFLNSNDSGDSVLELIHKISLKKEFSETLLEPIRAMSRSVLYTQQLFEDSSKTLEELVCTDIDSTDELLRIRSDWSKLNERFDVLVLKTQELSSAGAQVMRDFVGSFGRFLMNPGVSVDDKCLEIVKYQTYIVESSNYVEARSLSSELSALSSDVETFKQPWLAYTGTRTKYFSELQSSIESLRKDLKSKKEQLLTALGKTVFEGAGAAAILTLVILGSITSLSFGLDFLQYLFPPMKMACRDARELCKLWIQARKTKSKLLKKEKKLQRDLEKGRNSCTAMTKCGIEILSLQDPMEIFPNTWIAIVADLDMFQTLMKTESDELYVHQRLQKTLDLYKHLQTALALYARNVSTV
ncbi:hypothetical protein DFH11DRAFT_1582964 [Phellopilus nigrolimitatus]|nr:hypothetical protein DFH11DRAFT_1582964 [Phellopilus nigrolimitatus]